MNVLCFVVLLALTVGTFSLEELSPFGKAGHQHKHGHRHNRELCREFLKKNECPKGEHCRVTGGRPMCVKCVECPESLETKLVCGSDGVTYKSQCQLRRSACVENVKVHEACLGECPCEDRIDQEPRHVPLKLGTILNTRESDQYLSEPSEDTEEAEYQRKIEHEMKTNRRWMKLADMFKATGEKYHKQTRSWMFKKACSKEDLRAMPSRLLDWFHVLKASSIKAERRLRKKRDLSYLGSLSLEEVKENKDVCHLPVTWMFNFLDADKNEKLDHAELLTVEDVPYEHCMKPFFNSCNTVDPEHEYLTKEEFCDCFTKEDAPCRKQLLEVPTTVVNGILEPLLGAFQPHCDEDGFYHPVQCYEGACWCVDRLGVKIEGTMRPGEVYCDDNTEAIDNGEEEEEEIEETGDQ